MKFLALSALAGFAAAGTTQQRILGDVDRFSSAIYPIPPLGFGTWNLKGDNTSDVVAAALKTGYRHIDAASAYSNQKSVGKGIKAGMKASNLKRKDIWVTSKLWNDHHAPADVPLALEDTLKQLGLDYLDLYLMHWPVASKDGENEIDYIDTWSAMINLLETKKVRYIGICNFSPAQITALVASAPLHRPYMHQYEMHPHLPQAGFVATHKTLGIEMTAYSPLGNMNPTYDESTGTLPPLLQNEIVTKIASLRNCTPAQVVLSWGLSRGYTVIPKSSHVSRIEENFRAAQCDLEDADLDTLASLPTKRFNNPSKSWGVDLFAGLEDN